jgi:hypothetical protein
MNFPSIHRAIFEKAANADLEHALVLITRFGGGSSCTYHCLLCKTTYSSENEFSYHCNEMAHREKLNLLREDQESAKKVLERWKRIHICQNSSDRHYQPSVCNSIFSSKEEQVPSLLSSVEQLGLQAWRIDVQAALFRYLMAGSSKAELKSGDTEDQLFRAAVSTLLKHHHSERVALLELAVWKATCLAQMPVTGYHAAQEWIMGGWKKMKLEQRRSNDITVVVTAVLPFLE